jgi:hypothetical protein
MAQSLKYVYKSQIIVYFSYLQYLILYIVIRGLVRCPGQNKRIAPLSFFLSPSHGCRKRLLK